MAERSRTIITHLEALWQKMLYPVRKCKFFFFFLWLMNMAISITANCLGIDNSFFLAFLLSVFDSYLLCLPCSLLRRIHLGWLVYIPAALILFSELFVVFFNHSLLNKYAVQLVLETNQREGSQFVGTVLFHWEVLAAVAILILVAVFTFILLSAFKKYVTPHPAFKSWCLFLLSVLILWSGSRQLSAYRKLYRSFSASNAIEFEEPECQPHLSTSAVRLVHGIAYNSILSTTETKELTQTVRQTAIESCSFRSPLIVLIIGESYSKHHCFLYNRQGPTNTPQLQKWADSGRLALFTNVISPFNHTHEVFRNMFSTWDDLCQDSWTKHTLVTAAFKKAGYQVHFITNQFTLSDEDKYNILGGTIFNHAALSKLQFTSRNQKEYPFDKELLNDIPSVQTLTSQPTLLIIHLLGQHVPYEERYPAAFKRFTEKDISTPYGGVEGKKITADYENAVYYNDNVIGSLLQKLAGTDMIAIYLSDHGEEVFDWRDKFMRTDEPELTPEIARYQYEIPFMCIMTDRYQKRHQEIAREVWESTEKPFILTDLPNMLFHLGGIGIKDYHEERDLLSPRYDTNRKRLIRHQVDYDRLMNTQQMTKDR